MLINIFKKYGIRYLFDIKLIFFIFCWLSLWLSINAKPSQLSGDGIEFLNGIRSIIPNILIFPLIYFFLKKLNIKEFLNSILKIQNSLFFFLIIYVICKFLGGLHLYGEKNFLEFNYLTYSFLSMILIIFNYLLIKDKKKFIIFTSFISLFFVLILTIFYTYVSLKVYFVNPDLMFTKWMYAVHPISNEVLSSPYPRITGMSRIIAILSIVFFIFFLISKNFNARLILFITFNFFSLIIWMMQSRGTLICFISTILILIIFNNNLSHFKKVLLILVLISIPSSIAELISNYKFNYNLHNFYNKCILKIDNNYREDRICDTTNYTYSLNYEFVENYFKKKEETSNNNQNINNNNNNLSSNSEINSNSEIKNVNKYPGNEARLFKPHSHPTAGYTSGRIDIWKRIFKLYDFKKFFGLGAQGDRQILMGEESKFILSSNASNLIIYSFISAGYLGVLSIFIVYLVLSLKILRFFFENKKLFHEYNFFRIVGSSLLIFLLIRSLVENSFGVFSIDALLFVNAILLFFSKFNFKLKNNS